MTTALGLATGEDGSPLNGAVYCALGLAGEAGEAAEKVKKAWRNGTGIEDRRGEDIAYELGDVLWYLAACAHAVGYSLEDVAMLNVLKLASRKERSVVASEGDSR